MMAIAVAQADRGSGEGTRGRSLERERRGKMCIFHEYLRPLFVLPAYRETSTDNREARCTRCSGSIYSKEHRREATRRDVSNNTKSRRSDIYMLYMSFATGNPR